MLPLRAVKQVIIMVELLETRELCREFGGVRAVIDLNLTVSSGQIVGLIGPNGAGKTTLFNLISGFLSPTSGRVLFRGRDITEWSVHRRVKAGITRTFQVSKVFPRLTVRENVLTGTYTSRGTRGLPGLKGSQKLKGTDLVQSVDRVMEIAQLSGFENKLALELSYGYRRRLELAIGLATNPELLLLDEPFSGTSPFDLDELVNLLKQLNDHGVTILVVEHDLGSIANIVDRLVYMDSGRVVVPGE